MPDFHGETTGVLANEYLRLEYLTNSARIVRLSFKSGPNLFADLGLDPTRTRHGSFLLRGGHRLWHAPEAMPRTNVPDNEGASIMEIPNGVRIEMPAESWTLIAKAIEVRLEPDQARVSVQHELRNDGAWAVELSPWALTMFRLGGVAILPQPTGEVDQAGLLPNRRLSLWPYTRIGDARLMLRDDYVLVRAVSSLPALKLGYYNPHGWSGYYLDGVLFVKHHASPAGMRYPDNGCNSECYCNDKFVELESLGPMNSLDPGRTVVHSETWELHATLDVLSIPKDVQQLVSQISGLES